MTNVLIFDTENFRFNQCAPIVGEFLGKESGITPTLTADRGIFTSGKLGDFDALLLGGGFARMERTEDGRVSWPPFFEEAEVDAILSAVRGGVGLVGVHTIAWMIGGRISQMTGGAISYHAPGLREVTATIVDAEHPILRGVPELSVPEDEIYVTAYDPSVHILAYTKYEGNFRIPVAWTHSYGKGKVFYTTFGHGPSSFQQPNIQRMLANAVRWVAAG